jgi:hypothetical protein
MELENASTEEQLRRLANRWSNRPMRPAAIPSRARIPTPAELLPHGAPKGEI